MARLNPRTFSVGFVFTVVAAGCGTDEARSDRDRDASAAFDGTLRKSDAGGTSNDDSDAGSASNDDSDAGSDPPESPDIDAGGGDPELTNPTVQSYLGTLPTWREFSPKLEDQPPAPIEGREPVVTVETVEQEVAADPIDDAEPEGEGTTPTLVQNVTYDCSEVPYSLANNPQELITSDPNRDILYPGAMLQGVTHRDGSSIGDLLPLTIQKRAPIRVSIPDVANADSQNFRLVAPNQAEVGEAVGNIIGNATRDDLDTPSSISFEMKTYHSEQQFALEAGLSGRYLGFKASASGSVEQNASETTIAVQFTQRMYTVVVEPPGPGPESFFREDFGQADLDSLIEAGRIGPNNLPVYVSSVVYGRMMTFAMTSTASESEIKAALRASYDAFAGGVDFSAETEQARILQESTVVLSTLGGDASDALKVVRSGDWSQYFEDEAALSTAVPLSYTFKNLGDSSIASVSEASEYTIKTCTARQSTPGIFDVPGEVTHELAIGPTPEVITADVNGDGLDDLVYNSRGTENQVAVLLATAGGSFTEGPSFTHEVTTPTGSWGQYRLRAGDIDGDSDADLVWNYNRDDGGRLNILYVALSGNGTDGAFAQLPVQQVLDPAIANASYGFFLADVNGDRRADAIWSSVGARDSANYIHLGLAKDDGTFRIEDATYQTYSTGVGWSPYRTHVGDFDGDGLADVLWNAVGPARNDVHAAFANPALRGQDLDSVALDGAFLTPNLFQWPGDWNGYFEPLTEEEEYTLVGDIDGAGGLDLAWVKVADDQILLYAALNDGTGFVRAPTHNVSDEPYKSEPKPTLASLVMLLADVAGDDKADLLINQKDGATNRIYTGLSNGDGSFDHSPLMQELTLDPSDNASWGQYRLLVGNFGGSNKRDLAWALPTAQTRIHVGIAK